MKNIAVIITTAIVLLVPQALLAHPGGLDANNCHTCRTNCEEKYGIPTGWYHCHTGGNTAVYTEPPTAEEPEQTPTPEPEPTPEPTPTPEPEPNPEPTPAPEPEPTPDSAPTATTQATPRRDSSEIEPAITTDSPEKPQNSPEPDAITENGDEITNESAIQENESEDSQDSNEEPTTAGGILGLAILGGMGYGSYKGIKSMLAKRKKR